MSKEIDIVVANQPWYYQNEDGSWEFGVRGGSRWPHTLDEPGGYKPFPFFLSYTDAWLKDKEFNSIFIDAITKQWTYAQFYNNIYSLNPEYVLLETSTPSIDNDLEVAKVLHNEFGIKVIFAGTHATVFADQLIEKEFIFAIIKGEMEKPTQKILETGEPGIYDYDIIEDLDKLPLPTRHNDIFMYKERTHGHIPKQVNLRASRGCPFNCSFCQWPTVYNNKNYRQRSPEHVAKEIEHLVGMLGDDIFLYFDDDTFNIGEERIKKIADVINEFDLKWSAMCRIDTLSKDTWKYLHDRGLVAVNLGVESGSQKVLDTINKNLDIEEAKDMLEYLDDLGMYIHLTFTHGVPGETEEDFKKTKEFFENINVPSKQESRCIAMPGTDMYEEMDDDKRRKMNYNGLKGDNKKLGESYSRDYYSEFQK